MDTPIKRIRVSVFGMKQTEFADAIGVAQSTVSRWEAETLAPTGQDMAQIRKLAVEAGKEWSDAWFFEGPPANEAAA